MPKAVIKTAKTEFRAIIKKAKCWLNGNPNLSCVNFDFGMFAIDQV